MWQYVKEHKWSVLHSLLYSEDVYMSVSEEMQIRMIELGMTGT